MRSHLGNHSYGANNGRAHLLGILLILLFLGENAFSDPRNVSLLQPHYELTRPTLLDANELARTAKTDNPRRHADGNPVFRNIRDGK